ncbi:M81 family metallopeptidase [Billgrantia kenyensis]|uniref:Microcystinase C n=1 Tax=Billgrantia kenyensis TaxID=321266 RepID=A0A7V9W305_9GAMM|nr:M81 family metallopeptidase [Halomonas kenyensis]MBA2780091.1 M81 family metallopeptidase [Halomonas kenyensis]MCG6661964.1 M81 family metallopeptidase [Halomonas kenyensis]
MIIGVARLWHEANSFSSTRVGREEFLAREWLKGSAAIAHYRDTSTELGGAIEWAAGRDDVTLVVSRCASAPPGGPVEQALLDAIIDEIVSDPNFDSVDGLYLSLHGACSGTGDLAPETTLLQRLRQRFPTLPIAASFDMHCCPTETLVSALNVATVYRTYPHVDMDRAAKRALDLLAMNVMRGVRSRVLMHRIGRVLPSFNMRTDGDGPMADIEAEALALERKEGDAILGVYPYASFAYADLPATDAGALVTTTDDARAQRVGNALAQYMFCRRAAFCPALPSADECLARQPWCSGRRVAVLDPADNPLSGGMADTPGLLAAALRHELPPGSVLAFFHDPALVAHLHEQGEGTRLSVTLGGRHDRRFGEPVTCQVEVALLTAGRFVNSGPMERGVTVDLGPTAVIRTGPLSIIVTSVCQSPNDAEYFRLHGMDPEEIPLLLAKAKNHFRAALGSAFDEIHQVEVAGPAMADTAALPYRNLPPARFELGEPLDTTTSRTRSEA